MSLFETKSTASIIDSSNNGPGSQIQGYFQALYKQTPFFPSVAFEIDLIPGVWLVESSVGFTNVDPFVGTETITMTTDFRSINPSIVNISKVSITEDNFMRFQTISGVFVINKPTTVFTLLGIDANLETTIQQTNLGNCVATRIA